MTDLRKLRDDVVDALARRTLDCLAGDSLLRASRDLRAALDAKPEPPKPAELKPWPEIWWDCIEESQNGEAGGPEYLLYKKLRGDK